MNRNPQIRRLPEHPDLDQLRRQAKELLRAWEGGEAEAIAEAKRHWKGPLPEPLALHDAQLVLARAYGYESWPRMKAYIAGVSVARLERAAAEGDIEGVREILRVRPETARDGGALLQAVRNRDEAMVELLLAHGANARSGVYPHREATSPRTMAVEREYVEIVARIDDWERRRATPKLEGPGLVPAQELFRGVLEGRTEEVIAVLEAEPGLLAARHPYANATLLHAAARRMEARLVGWLLEKGVDPGAEDARGLTALDWAAHRAYTGREGACRDVARLLLEAGAKMTLAGATALGDEEWIRGQAGRLEPVILDTGGPLRIAVRMDRSAILDLLLERGLDPNEEVRHPDMDADGGAGTSGMALNECAANGKLTMAEALLRAGADPNAAVYASGDPVFTAYSRRDEAMIALLARYGGVPCASTAGLFRQTALGRRMLAGEAEYRLERPHGLAEEMLWGAACGGDPELVRLSLERIDWEPDDARWFPILEQPLRFWDFGGHNGDDSTYLECFRQIVRRCDPNLRGRTEDHGFAITALHHIAGARASISNDKLVPFAEALLDRGARLDLRDGLLASTPLGWACRWNRVELVRLFLERGADPVEKAAAPWATPIAWARKAGSAEIVALLESAARTY